MRTRSASERFAISTRVASTFMPTRCWPIIASLALSGAAGLMEATSNAIGRTESAVVCAHRGVANNKKTQLIGILSVTKAVKAADRGKFEIFLITHVLLS